MTFRLRSCPAVLAVAIVVAFAAPPASAQSTPSHGASLSDALKGPAKDAYESGRLLAANHDFEGALTKFEQAYSLSNDPRLLYNMAICNKELRHYARMQSLLQKYSREEANLSPENRTAVDQALAAIKPLVANVQVTVNEAGAAVSVDGEAVGTTPLRDPLALDLGKHTLTVKKAGFETSEQTIATPGGGATSVAVTLAAQKHVAQLVVTAEEGATVFVDDKAAAQGRFEGPLEPGSHHVRVTEPGKVPYASDVDLRDGETRTVEVSLESNEHHAPLIWPWIVGGVVVAAGAAVGGYFLFKPSDTTGPAPSGKLGQVSFATFR